MIERSLTSYCICIVVINLSDSTPKCSSSFVKLHRNGYTLTDFHENVVQFAFTISYLSQFQKLCMQYFRLPEAFLTN